MLVLMKTAGLYPNKNPSPDELAEAMLEHLVDVFNEDADDDEAYIHQPDGGLSEELELMDGREHPERILNLARGWNEGLAADFDMALSALTESAGRTKDGRIDWLSAKSPTIYEMKKAAMALDNDFYTFAEKALLVNDRQYLTTVLQPDELKAIEADPGNYAALSVYVK